MNNAKHVNYILNNYPKSVKLLEEYIRKDLLAALGSAPKDVREGVENLFGAITLSNIDEITNILYEFFDSHQIYCSILNKSDSTTGYIYNRTEEVKLKSIEGLLHLLPDKSSSRKSTEILVFIQAFEILESRD